MPTRVSAAADLERELLTATDFLEWLEPDRHADLIDGEVFMHSPVSIRHADLLNFVDRLLGSYVDRHRLGSLYREVVAVRLSGRNVFMPDLPFYRAGREAAIRETHISEAPDFPIAVMLYRSAELPNRYLFRVAVLDMFSLLGFVVSLFPPNAVSTMRKISQKIDLSVGPLYKNL